MRKTPIVDASCPERDRTRSQVDCPFVVRLPVAHHPRAPVFVSHVAQLLDMLLDFQFWSCHDHPTISLPGEFVQRLLALRSSPSDIIRGKPLHSVSFRGLRPSYMSLLHPQDTPLFLECQLPQPLLG